MIAIFYLIVSAASCLALDASSDDTFNGKIIGGKTVSIEEYPYQLSLRHMNRHLCGASILSQIHAITAAHCTKGMNLQHLSIHSGITSLDDNSGQIIQVKAVHMHPKFNVALFDYDLAILELAEDIEFSERSLPIRIIETNESLIGEVGVVTGWGVNSEDGVVEVSNDLQGVEVPIIDHQICKQAYEGIAPVTPRMFCARYENGGKDSCQGDSGGPFAVNGELVGVVSWGNGCGEAKYPGVYTNISAISDFVRQVMKI